MPITFVPKEYSYILCNGFRLWHSTNETKSQIDLIIDAGEYALEYVCHNLKFKNLRKIEICLYHSNHHAVSSLNRHIPANMAMAPYSTDKGGLIIIQSAAADPLNCDLQRMRRLLAHEICHLFVTEKSGSSSVLGDGLKDMKVRPWINEGLAEYISWRCIGKENPILQKDFECIGDLDKVDLLLNDFKSDMRLPAFHTSSRLVEFFIGELGLLNFFKSIIKLSEVTGLPRAAFSGSKKHAPSDAQC